MSPSMQLVYAGLSWDPAIKGILTVLVGSVVLFGSVYLLIATNTGARLGMLISLSGLFGFMSILCMWWWIQPPGMGPKGMDPSWRAQEVYFHQDDGGQGPAAVEVLNQLPSPGDLPSAEEVIREHPELVEQLITRPENTSLSDIAGIDAVNEDGTRVHGANILKEHYGLETTLGETVELRDGEDRLNGWKVISTSNACDAAAAADASLIDQGLFTDTTQYLKRNAFEWNEEETLADACPEAVFNQADATKLFPEDPFCRLTYRIRDTFSLWHAPRYLVVQVQPVVEQLPEPGQAPPTPRADETQPVMSVVLLRNEGNVRAKPAYFFAINFSLFVVVTLMLHYRERTMDENVKKAEQEKAEYLAGSGSR
jgi:hypothetical protein